MVGPEPNEKHRFYWAFRQNATTDANTIFVISPRFRGLFFAY